MNYKLLDFDIHGDHLGNLVAIEEEIDLPFKIKRVYYVWGTDHNAIRGKHAHKNLQQVIICVNGECDFILDDGENKQTIHLNNPSQGLYINNNIWREFTNFSDDCVIIVLASEHYIPEDYIHNYEEFKKYVGK